MTARKQAGLNRLVCLLLAAFAVLGCVQLLLAEDPAPAVADQTLSIKIALLEDAVPAALPARVDTHGESTDTIQIAFGEPVALHVVVTNESEEQTKPMPCSLQPEWMPATLIIVHPDGRKTLSPLNNPHDLDVMPEVRAFKPREQLSGNLIACTDYRSELRRTADTLRFGYLFPEPGEYEMYVVYSTKLLYPDPDELDWIGWFLRRVEREEELIVSNAVRVSVGEAFAGWQELREAGLIRALRFGHWESPHFADDGGRAKIDALVEQSDREWLKVWYSKVEKRPPFRPTMP